MKQNIIITMLGLIVALLSYIAVSLPTESNKAASSKPDQKKQIPAYTHHVVRYYIGDRESEKEFMNWLDKLHYEYVGLVSPFYDAKGKIWGYDILLRRPK